MLLFLHGALYTGADFEPLSARLSDDIDYRVLDFSGHGSATMPQEPFSIRLFADDVLRRMDDYDVERVDIFGFSMGGYVGLYLARFHPERVGRVMTLGTKLEWTPEQATLEVRMLDPDKIAAKVPAFADVLKRRHGEDRWQEVLRRTAGMMMNLGAAPELPYDQFENINVPVRLGIGDRDMMVSVDETLKAYRLLPAGEFCVLPGVGHPLEKAPVDRLAREIEDFFAS